MKKCASCTKDLPDAALHCVFCGAKQPPAPATGGGVAKTVMGYSAAEMIEQIRAQQAGKGGNTSNPNTVQLGPTPQPVAPPTQPAPSPFSAPAAPRPNAPAPATMIAGGANMSGPQPPMGGAPSGPMGDPRTGPMSGPMTGPMGGGPMGGPMGPGPTSGPMGMPNANASGGQPPMNNAGYAPLVAGGGPVPTAGNVAPTMFAQPAPSFPQPGPAPMGTGPMNHASSAPTMMVQPNAMPPPAAPHQQATMIAGAPAPAPMPMPMPAPQPVPQAPPPMMQPMVQQPSSPHFTSQTAARIGRPVEPWKDSLRRQMFIWGAALLVAFAVPVSLDPFLGNWDAIIDGAGTAKLPPLLAAAIGLLSIALAAIPTSPTPRGMMAALLGLTGVYVPTFLNGVPPYQALLVLGGMTVLIPGLILRGEYRDAIMPKLLVTIGALAALSVFLIPDGGEIPLVDVFKAVIDAPGKMKLFALIPALLIVVLALSLLAWLPSPSSGAAPIFAWVLMLWPLVVFVLLLLLDPGGIPDVASKTPDTLLSWVHGLNGVGAAVSDKKDGALAVGVLGIGISVAYGVLIGFGAATMLGKKLE